MLDQCSTPSLHYWIGNIDWLEQALTLHIKDCVSTHKWIDKYIGDMNFTFQSMQSQGKG